MSKCFVFLLVRGHELPHITQLSANEIGSGETYNTYIFPKMSISEEASRVTGIYVSEAGEFMVNGEIKRAVGICNGLRDFFYWLKKFTSVVLIAHNERRFYFPVLVGAARYCHLLDVLYSIVRGCIGSLSVFRKVFPGQPSYKQELLVKSLLQTSYKAHDAFEDVKSLSMLFRKKSATYN